MKKFGGVWTEEKLQAFEKYVMAYLKILNKAKQKYGWKTIYFDGFAGFGERIDKIPQQNSLFELIVNDEEKQEYAIYKGSVERILSLPDPYKFDWYYFIENNQKYVDNLINLIREKYEGQKSKIVIRKDDCNHQLSLLANLLQKEKNYVALILLDPFGMQLKWESIQKLRDTRSDVWILIPSGVAINRMLPKSGDIKFKEKLEEFFGMSISELENIFYVKLQEESLFGSEETVIKIERPIEKITEIYINQLKSVWKYVTERAFVLFNSKNTPIFHFLFASNNQVGFKIASYIIDAYNKNRVKDEQDQYRMD